MTWVTWVRRLATVAAAGLALGTAGCASGEHDTTVHFLVEPVPGGTTWSGWTELTLGVDIDSVGTTNLWGVTLGMNAPAPVPDLTFLSSLLGQSQVGDVLTPIVSQDSFPAGEPSVELKLLYFGDLHPLFESPNTIRLQWSGQTNPDYKNWPAGGILMQADIVINVQ